MDGRLEQWGALNRREGRSRIGLPFTYPHFINLKYKLPVGGLIKTDFEVPLSAGVWLTSVQLAVLRFAFCCNTKPVEGDGQAIRTPLPDRVTVSVGPLGACTSKAPMSLPSDALATEEKS